VAMMNRRGMLRAHTHWRPGKAPTNSDRTGRDETPGHRWRRAGVTFVVCFAAAAGAFAITNALAPDPSPNVGPATPTAWLDSFTAGVAREPAATCARLVTPSFREALAHDLHESCARYYARVQVGPIRILRVLQTRTTAAVEIRYWPRGGYWTFVLNRADSGWVAVAIVPGGPLPIA
jgi:hypothetical protein